jgi:hypothetical protein
MLNLNAVQSLVVSLLGIVVIISGLSIVGRSRRADMSESARTAGNTLIGVVVASMGIAITATLAFGQEVLTWLGVG